MGFSEYRDIIIYYNNKLYINNKVHPFDECTLLQMIKAVDEYPNKQTTKFKVWVHGKLKDVVMKLNTWSVKGSRVNLKDGWLYYITDHFVFTSTNVILTQDVNFVKDSEAFNFFREQILDYNRIHRYINYYTCTHTMTAIKKIWELCDYQSIKSELVDVSKTERRCPPRALTYPLIYGNKAGITGHDEKYEEMFLQNVYSFDASSAYPSMCFYPDFPIGELKEYNPTVQNVYTAYKNGWWFVAELVSDEVIEMPYQSFRPYHNRDKKEYVKFKDGYHYTVTPWDLANLLEHFKYDPFWDNKLRITKLGATNKVGSLNHKYLDYLYKAYHLKYNTTGWERSQIKGGYNSIVGKAHSPSILKRIKRRVEYWMPDGYLCPQFAQHIVAHQRYIITHLAYQLGFDNLVSLSTDCIKSLDPRLCDIIKAYNEYYAEIVQCAGYDTTELGQWKAEHYDWLVFIRDRVYFGVKKNHTKVSVALSSYKLISETAESLFADNSVATLNKTGPLWKDTNKRLKAKEEYEKWLSNGRTCSSE